MGFLRKGATVKQEISVFHSFFVLDTVSATLFLSIVGSLIAFPQLTGTFPPREGSSSWLKLPLSAT